MKTLFQELSGSFSPSSTRNSGRKVTPLADSAEIESVEARLMKSKRMKALNADPEFKAKISKAASARMKALHADPEFKASRALRKAKRIAKRIEELNKQLAEANAMAEAT